MYSYTTYLRWRDLWISSPEPAVIPKPPKVIGRRYNRHNSITPPLDFRLCSDAQFDIGRERPAQLGDQHGSLGNGCKRPSPSR